MKFIHHLALSFLFLSSISHLAAFAQLVRYNVIDLGTTSNSIASSSFAINKNQLVVGQSGAEASSSALHAVQFAPRRAPVDLGTLDGYSQSIAKDINTNNQIVGFAYNLGGLNHEAFMGQSGVLTPLGPFKAEALNDLGHVVGSQQVPHPDGTESFEAVYFDNQIHWLPSLGGENSFANDINSMDEIVGNSQLPGNEANHAVMWVGRHEHDLGTLGGANSTATAINEQHVVAGFSETANGATHACLFKVNANGQVSQRVDMGSLGNHNSYAFDINAKGVAVGVSGTRAFIYQNNHMRDLNSMIRASANWTLEKATSINDGGAITGVGKHDGRRHAYLLIPIRSVR